MNIEGKYNKLTKNASQFLKFCPVLIEFLNVTSRLVIN